jgi:hypothetical protein
MWDCDALWVVFEQEQGGSTTTRLDEGNAVSTTSVCKTDRTEMSGRERMDEAVMI